MGGNNNKSVVIVGSGPGGMYVVQALLEKAPGCHIDIIDRLPTPFGLIRGGVAPDHQHTKRVDRKYADIITGNDHVRFFGNVELGADVSVDELCGIYHAVVLAYGAPFDKKLGIPGEDKTNVFGSNAFVGWYNSHPDFRDLDPDLHIEAVAVIGIGNVAVDVARVLARTPKEMAVTDIADFAIDAIHSSSIRDIHMFGRRGPVEAAFTNTELKELGALAGAATIVDPGVIPDCPPAALDEREQKVRARILGTLRELSKGERDTRRRTLHLEFFASPVEILGDGRVEGIRMERTRVEDRRCVGTGETFDVSCGMVITCIGSRAEAIDGVPFDERSGVVVHEDGRVAPGVYAAGWVKRGATGTIGTNRRDSTEVADLIVADFADADKAGGPGFDALAARKGFRAVTFDDWLIIKRLEEASAGEKSPRRKFSTVATMLDALDKSKGC